MLPAASAGSITSAICCAREANISAISASGDKPGGARIQQHLADFLSRRRSARLARLDDLVSRRAQRRRELPHLRALARSVEPFKCDEFPAPRHPAE